MNWIRRIEVRGSQGDTYTVALADTGAWGCSCPAWRFKKKDHETGLRPDCKHIVAIKTAMPRPAAPRPRAPERLESRFAGLDLGELTAVASLEVGSRFRYLDLDIEVTH